MPRTSFIEQGERQVVLMDFSGIKDPVEALQAIEEARQFVAAQPRLRSLLTLVDITGSTQEKRVVDALGSLAEHDKPWVLAGAVVGVSTLNRILFKMVSMVSGRKFATFAAREDATQWLVEQWRPPVSVPDIAR